VSQEQFDEEVGVGQNRESCKGRSGVEVEVKVAREGEVQNIGGAGLGGTLQYSSV
jgi:hypothetical protein